MLGSGALTPRWYAPRGARPAGVQGHRCGGARWADSADEARAQPDGDGLRTVGGAELWEPFGTQTLKAVEGAKVVASTADPEWAQNALIADAHFINADWAKNKREVALKALKAMYDAIAYWKKNPEEANKIIADAMKMSVADVELVIGIDLFHYAGSNA